MNTATTTPRPATPYDALGGAAVIARIVKCFYDLMDSDPAYAPLRAMHAAELAPMRASLAGWLSAWAGGPRDWFEENPGKCVMSAHRGLGITPETARQWVAAMRRAIGDAGLPDAELGRLMGDRLAMMAGAMVPDAG